MKRVGNIFEKVISLENLRLADEKARKGKLHSYGVQLHDKNREAAFWHCLMKSLIPSQAVCQSATIFPNTLQTYSWHISTIG